METNLNPCLTRAAIVLPSLDPDDKFEGVVNGLIEHGFQHIVIVDDGSALDRQKYFDAAAAYPQCTVLHHGINKGKGCALKNAFRCVIDTMPEVEGVITIDGDGQHLIGDIIACGDDMLAKGDRMIVGSRDFDLPYVPPRSVAGNKTTARLLKLLFGIVINDSQTGLRAIPRSMLQAFCEIPGDRFEYETNMLIYMKHKGLAFEEKSIETVYDPDDYSSHYNAVKDSWRILKVMMKGLFGKF